MKRTLFLALSACSVALILDLGVARAQTCPSPLPSCSSSGSTTLAQVSGTYVCTQVGVNNANTVSGAVAVATFSGTSGAGGPGIGTGTANSANNNNGTGSTFTDFSGPIPITYCVNTDGTGYIFPPPPPSGACPLAAVFDDAVGGVFQEGRLIDTTEGNAEAIVCSHQ